MLFETFKREIAVSIRIFLDAECDGEQMDDYALERVAKYLYASEYEPGTKVVETLAEVLYAYERSRTE